MSRQLGFDEFRLAMQFIIGSTLTMQLTVANDSATPLLFEEAMHTYYHVGDVHETTLYGLEKTAFVDKADGMKSKPAANEPLNFTGPTDRVYPNTTATCVIHDRLNRRRISIEKTNSHTTVVFNPWKEMPDLGADEWHEMLAVETVNAAINKITLEQGKTHTMQAHVSVENEKA
jgi:glucose-6-phosphate 1-epimerase